MSVKRDEAYYSCPHCRGKVKVVLTEDGRVLLLKHVEESNEGL